MDDATVERRLALIRFYLPYVLAADGSEPEHWTQAKFLFYLSDNILQQYYYWHCREGTGAVLKEVTAAILYMEPMRLRLPHLHLEDLSHPSYLGDWHRLRARVQYTTPLVARLLRGVLAQ